MAYFVIKLPVNQSLISNLIGEPISFTYFFLTYLMMGGL